MAKFCIPPLLAQKLKAAAARGEIDVAKMYDMTSAERRAIFESYIDKTTAHQINLEFEKAMVSSKVTALKEWAEGTFKGSEEQVVQKKDILGRIEELQESGLLTPEKETNFYQDLVSEKLGLTVTAKEAQQISDLATKLQKEAEKESNFGTPTMEYFRLRREMQNYVESITPANRLKILTSIIGRGNMLARLSSPFINIESNTVMAAIQAFSRRLENRSVGGVNNDYATEYSKFAIMVYQKTGYDITRMQSIQDDLQVRGEDILTSQGPGTIRKVGRFYEDVVFKHLQGIGDIVFASFSASDRSNIESTKLARSKGLTGNEAKTRAREIFKDSTRIDPRTKEGRQVRAAAIADAQYSTYTNKSVYAEVSLGIRKVLNIASGDARIGDQLMPFVKTPANVIGTGINMSGIGIPIDGTFRLFRVMQAIKKGDAMDEAFKEQLAGFSRTMIQAGLGFVLAHLMTTLFDPEDYIGEYPVSEKERQLLALRNATTNSVRIGDKWISLDYFGPLGTAMTGIMYAKKYGDTMPEKSYQYMKGALAQASKVPGLESMTEVFDYLDGLTDKGKTKTMNDEIRGVMNYVIGFAQSRLTPGILYDIARMTDTSDRKTTGDGDIFARVKNSLPGMRQSLPEKKDVQGNVIQTEPPLSILFLGSRVKTARDNELITEFMRLDSSGNLPSITNVEKTSPRAKALKEQVGNEKFEEFMDEFSLEVTDKSHKAIKSYSYKRMTDEQKKAKLDKIKNDTFDRKLRKYGYKKK